MRGFLFEHMSNVVEFVIKLKDLIVAPMNNVGNKTQAVFNQMNNGLVRVQQQYRNTGSSIAQLNNKLNDLQKTRELSIDTRDIKRANREIQELEMRRDRLENLGRRNNGGGGTSALVGGLMSRFGPAALLAGGMMLGTNSVGTAMDAGVQKTSFETMAGKKQGGQLYDNLDKFARESIFGLDLMKDAQTMKAFGVETDNVMNRLQRLGDVSIGDTQKLNSLSLAYSQVFAGGKLTGQDNLQFINAGWNPLKELSQMTGKSMASMRKAMEEGKVSIGMIDKALDHATDKGGAFFEMTKKIGETSYGQLQGLKGNFEAFQKDLGNALMPLANDFMTLGNDVLSFLNISKSVPETLMSERGEINTLVNSIASLNEGNAYRNRLLDTLKTKFPDIFSNINTETIKNQELLSVLKDVNGEYSRRIGLASQDLTISKNNESIGELTDLALRFRTEANKQPGDPNSYVGFTDIFKLAKYGLIMHNTPEGNLKNAQSLESRAQGLTYRNENISAQRADDVRRNEVNARAKEMSSLIQRANTLLNDPVAQNSLWGKDKKKNLELLQREVNIYDNIQKSKTDALMSPWGNGLITQFEPAIGPLKELLNPGSTKVKPNTPTPLSGGGGGVDFGDIGGAGDRADKVTAGGQKQIIINVNKFVDEINITNTGNGGVMGETEVERIFTEQFLRVLQSADQTGN